MFNKLFLIIIMIYITSMLVMSTNKHNNLLIFGIIMLATMYALILYNWSKNSWASVSLYLTLVGGLMILFSMVSSIMPKSKNSIQLTMIPPIAPLISIWLTKQPQEIDFCCKTINFKMNIIFVIILILNLMLTFVSKMIMSSNKPFRSLQ